MLTLLGTALVALLGADPAPPRDTGADRARADGRLTLGTGLGYDDNLFWRFDDPAFVLPPGQRAGTTLPTARDGFFTLRPRVDATLWPRARHRLALETDLDFRWYFAHRWAIDWNTALSYRARVWRQLWLGLKPHAQLFDRGAERQDRFHAVGGIAFIGWIQPAALWARLGYEVAWRRFPDPARGGAGERQDDLSHAAFLEVGGHLHPKVRLGGGYRFGVVDSTIDAHDHRRHEFFYRLRATLPWQLAVEQRTSVSVRRLFDFHLIGGGSPSDRTDVLLQLGARISRPLGRFFRVWIQYTARLNWGRWSAERWRDHRQVALAGLSVRWDWRTPVSPTEGPRILTRPGKPATVVLTLRAPRASRVSVVGSFNAWNPRRHPMTRSGKDRWRATLSLPPGRYTYSFDVDGRVLSRPPGATRYVSDGFGGWNGVLEIGATH